ncbi:hypothetical protein L1887_44553 [Cichorium endivia]|nr:hypothetical protein L1887_44553 [Cichorium endivia]
MDRKRVKERPSAGGAARLRTKDGFCRATKGGRSCRCSNLPKRAGCQRQGRRDSRRARRPVFDSATALKLAATRRKNVLLLDPHLQRHLMRERSWGIVKDSALPGDVCEERPGEVAHSQLPQLLEHQHAHTKSDGEEVVLHLDAAREEDALERRDVAEEHGDEQRESHGGEQIQVLRALLADGRLLDDATALGAPAEQVEPLLNDEVEKVQRVGAIEHLVEQSRVVALYLARTVGEPHVGEGDAVALHVPECHGAADHGERHAHKQIGMCQQPPIRQTVLLDVARLALQQVRLGLLVHQAERRDGIGTHAHKDHLQVAQDLRQPKEERQQHRPQLGDRAGRKQVADGLFEVDKDQSAVEQRIDDRREAVEQHHIGRLHGDGRTTAHGNANVGLLETGCVVDAVARHADALAARLELLDDAQLLLGRGARKDDLVISANLLPIRLLHAHQIGDRRARARSVDGRHCPPAYCTRAAPPSADRRSA